MAKKKHKDEIADDKIKAERAEKRKGLEKYFTARRPDKALTNYIEILFILKEGKEFRLDVKSKLSVTNRTLRDLIMTDGDTVKAVSLNAIRNAIVQNDYLIVESIKAIEALYSEQDS